MTQQTKRSTALTAPAHVEWWLYAAGVIVMAWLYVAVDRRELWQFVRQAWFGH